MGRFNLEYFIARRIMTADGGRKNNVMVRIATISVAVGMAVMILSLAVILGFKKEIASKLSGFDAHIQIVNLDNNRSFETVPIQSDIPSLGDVEMVEGFVSAHPYALKAGMMRSGDDMYGIVLKGIDGDYDYSFFAKNLSDGDVLNITDSVRTKDILISNSLATSMNISVGDAVETMFIQNPPRRDRFRVKGIYDSGFEEMDKMMVFTDMRNVQRLNGWDSTEVTGIEIMSRDMNDLDKFTTNVRDIVSNDPVYGGELKVLDIKERYPVIFDWLDAHNVNAAIIITVMLLVALFNMIAALLIILLERTSMIGVLKALGMDNRALQKMFIIRSSFVILKGMFWGNIVGVGLCLLQHYTGWITLNQSGYFLTTVPIFINWGYWAMLNLITFIFIVVLLTLPTMIISLILPEKSIRFE